MKTDLVKLEMMKNLYIKKLNEINLIIKGDNNNVKECKITRVS
jgi:hypothetical protein